MYWLREHAWETWLALSIGLGVLEMFSLDFVLLMLAAGAAVGMIAALLGLPLILQVLLAAGAAVLSLAVIRPTVVKRLHQGPELQLGHAKLIGQRAVVLEEITSTQAGLSKLDGEQWTARSEEHTSELQSLMRISYAVFCSKKKTKQQKMQTKK